MPERRYGTCQRCGAHNVFMTLRVGAMEGHLVIAWACDRCQIALDEIRNERRNHGQSESQERRPGAGGAGEQ